jgi:hypothetical protein
MSSYPIGEDDSYDAIRAHVRERLAADRDAGGHRREWADRLESDLDRHVTADGVKGDRCLECGQPWPCDVIRFILDPGQPED